MVVMDVVREKIFQDMKNCKHVEELIQYLKDNELRVWGEFSNTGWVNVSCSKCVSTFETELSND